MRRNRKPASLAEGCIKDDWGDHNSIQRNDDCGMGTASSPAAIVLDVPFTFVFEEMNVGVG
ncbi:hypothetical protein GC093_17180 [Paenibacillus sp. LMG 31456]|uniref:Uncharacterized protein n=1 Tax=Paenibacillus foliorum TaxID=2654974 RepID=A0A972K0R4_9BACL|nr:hypothetical protein [Paenibacillus foliorum]NOU94941.1 hypothetical protein [Paenibacillus foliorum]